MNKETPNVPGISEGLKRSNVPLSAAVKANGFVFVSGMPPMDPKSGGFVTGDIRRQTEACLEAVKACLEGAGSSLEKVVKVTIYCSNAAHYRAVNEVYARYFPENPPARTFVAVASWPMEFDMEIECVALE